MAYVNVLDWKAEQVADWLRGLEDTVYPYAHFFLNNDVTGQVCGLVVSWTWPPTFCSLFFAPFFYQL